MWSLYKLGDGEYKYAPPLRYSTGKTQENVLEEIVEGLEKHDVVLFKGAVGTGKSAVALHVCKEMGRGIVVVPTKVLERQYARDYGGNLFAVKKDDDSWLSITMLMGRSNFECPFGKCKANDLSIPCRVPLKPEETRVEVASQCPHYSPIVPSRLLDFVLKKVDAGNPRAYMAVGGEHAFIERRPCGFYEQYRGYIFSDVLVMNEKIWEAETILRRKPHVPVEIIDEGDAFLDGLTLKVSISERKFEKLRKKIESLKDAERRRKLKDELEKLYRFFKGLLRVGYNGKETDEYRKFLEKYRALSEGLDESAYRIGSLLESEFYVHTTEKSLRFFVPAPDKVLRRYMRLSGKLVLMSATIQSVDVLEDVFGLRRFVVVEGEVKFPGRLYVRRVGTERWVTYKKWEHEDFRERYWLTLMKILENASRPTVVHVFRRYLPEDFDGSKLRDVRLLEDIGEEDGELLVFSTISYRGVDLRDEKCRSIVVLKYPYPDLNDPVLQTMKMRLGEEAFWRYYEDIARRTFIQQVGRGLRHENDWCEFWSPDLHALVRIEELWEGELVGCYRTLTLDRWFG